MSCHYPVQRSERINAALISSWKAFEPSFIMKIKESLVKKRERSIFNPFVFFNVFGNYRIENLINDFTKYINLESARREIYNMMQKSKFKMD